MKKVLLSSILSKEDYTTIRSEQEFDNYIFSCGMPNLILFDTVSWNIVGQIDEIIKGAMYNIEAYELPEDFSYGFTVDFKYKCEIEAILDYYLSLIKNN